MPPFADPRMLVARLRAELARPPGQARIRRAELLALLAYLQRCLRLMPYVRHAPDCRQALREGRATECSCGLQRAFDEGFSAPSPAAGPPPGPRPAG